MNMVKVKFVETGTLSVKQQTLPGLGEGNKVEFRREFGALAVDLSMAVDMAMASIPHIYKKNKLQVFVVNSKNNREEMAFEEQGRSETNPDEAVDDLEKPAKLSVVKEGDLPEEGEEIHSDKKKKKG